MVVCVAVTNKVAIPHESFCSTFLSSKINFQEANKPPDSWFELKVNPHIYVTGLPNDVTLEEVSCGHCFIYYYIYILKL